MPLADYESNVAPPIAAIFLVVFDKKVGYKIAWERRLPDVDIEGVDFKSLPSGLHNVEQDLVYFTHGDYAGISAFHHEPGTEADRNANFLAVGVLASLNFGRLGRSWMHAKQLRDLSRGCITGDTADDHAELEKYWQEYKLGVLGEEVRKPSLMEPSTPTPKLSHDIQSHKRRSRALSDAAGFSARDQCLSPDHPALSMPYLLDTFGPLIFPLYKVALLRKRILLLGSVPIRQSCNFVYDLSIFANIPSALDGALPSPSSMNRIRPLFNVGIHDIPNLSARAHTDPGASGEGWIACTTDDILATKKDLFDVLVQLPLDGKANQWPKITTSNGTVIRATQRDRRRYTSLRKELSRMSRRRRSEEANSDSTKNESAETTKDSCNERQLLLGTLPGQFSVGAESGLENESAIIEPSSWASIAYSSFLWWATAGERMDGQDDEADRDAALLDDLVSTTSASTTPRGPSVSTNSQKRASTTTATASLEAPEHVAGTQAKLQETQQTAMILIAYFHRLTVMIMGGLGDIINHEENESSVQRGAGDGDADRHDADAAIELSADEVSRIGLDGWSASDATFMTDLAWVWWARDVRWSGRALDICGIRIC